MSDYIKPDFEESIPVEVWLWLLIVMGPYNPKTMLILSMYDYDVTEAAKAVRDGKIEFLSDDETSRAKETRNSSIYEIMSLCKKNNVKIVTLDSKDYPKLLRNIENPPVVLFCAGDLSGLDKALTVSAVGTRDASEYSYNVTKTLISPLVKLGVVVTSGLAFGLDTAVHKACLDAGGRTIGVCGCGILVDYPKGSGNLKRRIVESGGAVISELLPFAKTWGGYFQHRNRIISGLSYGTVVIEAGEVSGCLLTAQHAVEQGREVFAVPPHSILEARYAGTAALCREGAVPVFGYIDIVNALMKDKDASEYFKKVLGRKM